MVQKFGQQLKKIYSKVYSNLIYIKIFPFAQIFNLSMVSMVIWHYRIVRISIKIPVRCPKGSVPVDFLRPKFRVAHTKDDVISILMHKYTYTNMYIIKKIISCRFILCWDITSLFKPYEKSCRRRKVKIEKILTVTYRTLLTKTTNFLKSGGYKICLYLKIISYST